jgi:hypothetical protein
MKVRVCPVLGSVALWGRLGPGAFPGSHDPFPQCSGVSEGRWCPAQEHRCGRSPARSLWTPGSWNPLQSGRCVTASHCQDALSTETRVSTQAFCLYELTTFQISQTFKKERKYSCWKMFPAEFFFFFFFCGTGAWNQALELLGSPF